MELASAALRPESQSSIAARRVIEERAQRIAAKVKAARIPATQDEQLKMLDLTPSRRFDPVAEADAWLEHLDREGYVVLASVLTKQDCMTGDGLLWNFLEANSSWRRSQPETWSDDSFGNIGSIHNGLVKGAGIGHSDFLWFVRTRPAVRQAFERIWNTSELLVSFDGANVFRPWHHGFAKTVCGWWHTDQGAGRVGRQAVQGLVSIYAANARTGGLTVVPQSHLRHREVVEDQQNPSVDYCTVRSYEPLMQELPQKLVTCEAGDLILWDSRLVHANAPAPQEPVGPADRLLRAVAYVCMVPQAFASSAIREGRRAAYEHGFVTSHWPQKLDLGPGPAGVKRSLAEASEDVRALVG